jgi:histidyl-tRNA synthetase
MVQLIEKKHPGITRAPQSMEYLIEEERRRFWEFIEYLEAADITYELDPLILGSRECWSHTLFEVRAEDASGARVPFAFGGRYDPLAGKIVGQPAPSAMAAIPVELHGKTRVPEPACITPTLYFAHLGTEARRRSFRVIEILRQAGIPIHQSLLHERLGDQMVLAKRHGVPFILIIGHKEAVEGTVLVREVATNEQEAVPTDELVAYLRRHRIAAVA